MGRELDIQCGRALGWSIDFTGGILRAYRPDGALAYLPLYSDDHTAARLLEDEMDRREIQGRYVQALGELLAPDDSEWTMINIWALMRATPEQRARAFLEAIR